MTCRFRRGSIAAAGAALVAALCGCGAKEAFVATERYFPTGLSPRESVVILLDESAEDPDAAAAEGRERSIAVCVADGMKGENRQLAIVKGKEFQAAIFPGKAIPEVPHSTNAFVSFLADEGSRRRVEALGVRCMLLVEMRTSRVGERPEFAFEHGLWAIGQSWTRRSVLYASVIDVRRPGEAGRLSSNSEGPAGFVVPVVVVIPLPPVIWSSRTESKSCAAPGPVVVRFLEGREAPDGD